MARMTKAQTAKMQATLAKIELAQEQLANRELSGVDNLKDAIGEIANFIVFEGFLKGGRIKARQY